MRQEQLQDRLASEYAPNPEFDAKLLRGHEWLNTNTTPSERMRIGHYLAKREAFEQQQRTERAAAAKAAKAQASAR